MAGASDNARGSSAPSSAPGAPFFGGGEAGALLRAIDWTGKSPGRERWPQSLRTAVGLCLSSRQPMFVLWGRERRFFYNDAFAPILGTKHPAALLGLAISRRVVELHRGLISAANAAFDLLISDTGLPDDSGHDLMAGFRERCRLKGIALTGYGMDDDVRCSQNAGFVMHLAKPVRVEYLDQALAAAFGRVEPDGRDVHSSEPACHRRIQ